MCGIALSIYFLLIPTYISFYLFSLTRLHVDRNVCCLFFCIYEITDWFKDAASRLLYWLCAYIISQKCQSLGMPIDCLEHTYLANKVLMWSCNFIWAIHLAAVISSGAAILVSSQCWRKEGSAVQLTLFQLLLFLYHIFLERLYKMIFLSKEKLWC